MHLGEDGSAFLQLPALHTEIFALIMKLDHRSSHSYSNLGFLILFTWLEVNKVFSYERKGMQAFLRTVSVRRGKFLLICLILIHMNNS